MDKTTLATITDNQTGQLSTAQLRIAHYEHTSFAFRAYPSVERRCNDGMLPLFAAVQY
jgi:hypothetical protein